jgi:hypothetical protein
LKFSFKKSESSHGGSMLSVQIGFVGLVTGISRHAILLGRERMHDARFKPGAGERTLGSEMVVSSSLQHDDGVLNIVLLLSLMNLRDGCLEVARLMLERLWLNEQPAKVIRHHPLGTILGWIDTDDGESITANLCNARRDDTARLL